MYLAMNRFKIVLGREDDFETVWKSRETHLEGIKGFKKFNLIKGVTNKEFSLYVSHSEWIRKMIFGVGQSLSRLDWPTKMLLLIEIYT